MQYSGPKFMNIFIESHCQAYDVKFLISIYDVTNKRQLQGNNLAYYSLFFIFLGGDHPLTPATLHKCILILYQYEIWKFVLIIFIFYGCQTCNWPLLSIAWASKIKLPYFYRWCYTSGCKNLIIQIEIKVMRHHYTLNEAGNSLEWCHRHTNGAR